MPADVPVLHVIEDLGVGGAERLLATLLPLLPSRGFVPEVLSLGAREDLVAPLRESGVPVRSLGLSTLGDTRRAAHEVRAWIRGRGTPVVHTHLARANLAGRIGAWPTEALVTTTYHADDYEPAVLSAEPGLTRWKRFVYRQADRLTARRCARVVAVSAHVARSIERRLGLSPQRIEVIPNGVPEDWLTPIGEAARRAARQSLDLPDGSTAVLQLARLVPQKGPGDTVAAAALLRDRPIVWLLAGDGPLRPELEGQAAREGVADRVRFLGARSDVRPLLAACDLLVMPSRYEGLGIAALEAMASGLPVVAYRTGPLPEVVLHEQTGLLAPPNDVRVLAQAVETLAADPAKRREYGDSGRERVRQRFLISTTADRHAALYRALLEGR